VAVAPATASAATIGVVPSKPCYRSGEEVGVVGSGFTPGAAAEVTLDRRSLGRATANALGRIGGLLSLGRVQGERRRLLAVTDQANPANYGVLQIRATGVNVDVRPRRAGPGRRVRIRAYGFTQSNRLYAHIRRGRRFHRDLLVGNLRRACHKLDRRVAIVPLGAGPGVYSVQFDGLRRYSRTTRPRVRYRVTVFRRLVRRRAASAAGATWVRLP
jgi:hypothetical protein